ncbi:MAG: protein secretion chaperonin CsaA [Acidobacteriia bacterium]|nr:protein secretion chaperonin CsaA [Terriglobia bacterium]
MPAKSKASFSNFEALDIRVGRIVEVEDAATRKPTYRLRVDFGPEFGLRVSCGAFRNYTKEELIGRQVVGILNFGPKQMGPEVSEFLMLGVPGKNDATIFLTPESSVELGVAVF